MPVVNTLYNILGPIEIGWDIPLDCSNVYVKVLSAGEYYNSSSIWFNDCIQPANGRPIYVTAEANPQADGVIPYNISEYSIKKDYKTVELVHNAGDSIAQLAIPIQNLGMYTSLLPYFLTTDFKLKTSREGDADTNYSGWSGMFIHEIENDVVRNTATTSSMISFSQVYMDGKDYPQGYDYYVSEINNLANGKLMGKRFKNGTYTYYRPDEVNQMWLVITYYCPGCWNPGGGTWYVTEEAVADTSSLTIDKCSIACSRYYANPKFDPVE